MSKSSTKVTFVTTCGPVDRLWCDVCLKATTLPDLSYETVGQLKAEHVCGPRTAPWGSAGVS